jgi:BirA family biotin operon repressor/biotin-[acetyl-CoA-carboxylase] ligase
MIDQSKNTLFIGKVAIHLKTVDSTNAYAKEMLSKSSPIEGTVITTDQQTAGRGQLGSKWQSEACQNIMLSVLLRPKFLLAQQQFALNAATALAVYDFLNQFELKKPLSIKWPNDLYIGKEKIAGILIENQLRGKYLDWSVVGIGINVNQEKFPSHLPNPSSLFLQTEKKYEIPPLLFQLYASLERHYLRIKAGRVNEIRKEYVEKLFQIDTFAPYLMHAEQKEEYGTIEGIDLFGRLLVRFKDRLQAFDLKEISPVL